MLIGMSKRKSDISQMKYEQALAELESILERMEAGEVPLEDAMAECERGANLIKHCRTILDRVEKKVAELTLDQESQGETEDEQDEDA